jgi:hypothetical protein
MRWRKRAISAARAARLPARREHEVLHQELAAALEQLGQRAPALGPVEGVALLDAHPRQRAALAGDPVAQVRQLLLVREQRLALSDPLVPRDDGMVHEARFGGGGLHGDLLDSLRCSGCFVVGHARRPFGRRTARTLPVGPPPQ